jgi:hypothetical protein
VAPAGVIRQEALVVTEHIVGAGVVVVVAPAGVSTAELAEQEVNEHGHQHLGII